MNQIKFRYLLVLSSLYLLSNSNLWAQNKRDVRPLSASHGTTQPQNVDRVVDQAKFKIGTLTKMLTIGGLSQSEISVSEGMLETISDPAMCSQESHFGKANFPKTLKEACPWGQLVKIQSNQYKGRCFCTSQNNIDKLSPINFEENGVQVVSNPTQKEEAKTPALESIFATFKRNACNKSSYVKDEAGRRRIRRCRERKKNICNCSILRCAQILKKSLFDAGLIKSINDLPGHANSSGIKQGLEKNGFKKCSGISNPRSAPNGAVLIYHARSSSLRGDAGAPYGHIEMKTPDGYVSDFVAQTPRNEYGAMATVKGKKVRNRYLAAVYVKNPVSCP